MGRVNTASKEKLSVIQQEVVIGTTLGDGRLECRSKNGSARLRVHHAESQREYLLWKYRIFQNIVTRKPWSVAWRGNQTGNIYSAWFFHTKTLHCLRTFQRMFYPNGKKVIPSNIENLLTPRALSIWFMDDGCMTKNSAIINTQCFTKPEQILLSKLFRDQFGIETKLNKDRLTYRLRMNRENSQKLSNIIKDFVPKCMQYKLTPRND